MKFIWVKTYSELYSWPPTPCARYHSSFTTFQSNIICSRNTLLPLCPSYAWILTFSESMTKTLLSYLTVKQTKNIGYFSNVDEGIWVVGEEGVLNDKISTKTSFRVSVWMNRIMTSQCWESFLRSILKERHCFSFVDKVTSVMSVFKRA